jgi:hypothetical protein
MKDQTIGGGCPSRHSDRHLSRIRVGGRPPPCRSLKAMAIPVIPAS